MESQKQSGLESETAVWSVPFSKDEFEGFTVQRGKVGWRRRWEDMVVHVWQEKSSR